ncbi:MAG: MBL fold metallo-hydrolase [Chloroflexota bacterium]|nr:MBL fold metallo-hydrolase [Chloroflexota bacterium]
MKEPALSGAKGESGSTLKTLGMSDWFPLGDCQLLVVSDGVLRLDAGAVFGLTPRIMWEPLAGPLDEEHRLGVGLNCLLVRSQGKLILVETGVGSKATRLPGAAGVGQAGTLLADLARQGIRPEEVDVVINTHLHFDHCGGNTTYRDDKLALAFPRARYFVQKGEWEAANHPNERTRATYLAENLEPLADSRRLELVEGEAEVTKEVRILPAPGHTADHAIVEVSSGGRTALYVGELAQHPVMLERLAWISAFDVLPLVTLETKRRILERAVAEDALLVCVHSPPPGIGRIRLVEGKRKWEAA